MIFLMMSKDIIFLKEDPYMKKLLIILLSLFMLCACNNNTNTDDTIDDPIVVDNKVKDFDLAFLKLENKETNLIYSPLSIKYCLAILS